MTTFSSPPVLLIIFNRPDLTQRVLERLRESQPAQLFIAADGPRPGHSTDAHMCAQARNVVNEIDWPCEVKTLFRDDNLGCKNAVSGAITWFFEQVEQGIILEDDCVPHVSFFPFCAELLKRYENHDRIMSISGNNFQADTWHCKTSYYFSIHSHIWGWATWRRAWRRYDGSLEQWPHLRETPFLKELHGSDLAVNYWRNIFDKVYANEIDSWGYPWTYSCWVHNGLTILPAVNLVTNIGFDERATHTKNPQAAAANLAVRPIDFPLKHPAEVMADKQADAYTTYNHFGVRPRAPLWRQFMARARTFVAAKIK
ncbi:MAG: hypothetical protein KDE50_24180 [Caldilineaceae bacterium]|nr:hypothetical protein [Caldilineaceae bacterium]MCB0143019.1 hypothetical protein [Caldilineaceae bacterium]MCB9148563.1 hypothetical protein [Caldilineaceae bacterium]MCB9155673.1 hypothetical protein [Caldilineaceae bacterium]